MSKFSENLKELRKSTGQNQTTVANAIGVQYFTLGKWEQGRAEPSIQDLSKLADYFDVDIDYLVGREDDFGVIVSSKNDNLTREERELLAYFNEMDEYGREAILIQVKALAGQKDKVKG